MVATTIPTGSGATHRLGRHVAEVAAGLALIAASFVAGRATVDDAPTTDRMNPVVSSHDVGGTAPARFDCRTGKPC